MKSFGLDRFGVCPLKVSLYLYFNIYILVHIIFNLCWLNSHTDTLFLSSASATMFIDYSYYSFNNISSIQ